MAVVPNLSVLALRQLIGHACTALGVHAGVEAADKVGDFLVRRFTDHSLRLTKALEASNGRAWQVLEIALAGDSFCQRCRLWLAPREEAAFREQVRELLDATRLHGFVELGPEFRQQCLTQLRDARKQAVLRTGDMHPAALAHRAGAFARFAEPVQLLAAERTLIQEIATELHEVGYPQLSRFVALETGDGTTLLAGGVRYFFRRHVETDRELFQGLAFAQLEQLGQAQETGFAALADLLGKHGDQLEEFFDELRQTVHGMQQQQQQQRAILLTAHDAVLDVKSGLGAAHGDVLDIKSELARQNEQLQELGRNVLHALEQHRLARQDLRPGDSMSISSEGERRLVRSLMARFRALSEEERRRVPALLNGLGLLETAAGELEAARRDFGTVAQIARDPAAQAAALHNAYLAALEQRQLGEAFTTLQQAITLAPERFALFPTAKYEPIRILGAGGFGVAFLCKHRNTGSQVVVKAIRSEGLDRSVSDVFREARLLEELDHAAIIRLRDCDYADAGGTRPFLVMEFFDGLTLHDHVEQHGCLAAADLAAVVRPVAEALQLAHERGILHRDVKPANVLVRKEATGWRVKLIDFGLAMKRSLLQGATAAHTATGVSVAGTRDFAAPEQLGLLPGTSVGPAADIYGFAKTCCFALFRTAQPLPKHWRAAPPPLADLLESCLAETPAERPAKFSEVLERLGDAASRVGAASRAAPEALEARAQSSGQTPALQDSTPVAPVPLGSRHLPEGPAIQDTTPVAPVPLGKRLPDARTKYPPEPSRKEQVHRFDGHAGGVTCVAVAPDGRLAASGGRDGTVHLWDLAAKKAGHVCTGHSKPVGSVAFFPDGRRLLSGAADGNVTVWDVKTGKALRVYKKRCNWAAALSPDGTLALSGLDKVVLLWNLANGEEVRGFRGHTDLVRNVAFSPDGKQALSTGLDATLRLCNVNSGQQVHSFPLTRVWLSTISFTPDCCYAIGVNGNKMTFWDLRRGQQGATLHGNEAVSALVASTRHILSGSVVGPVRLWNLDTGEELACMVGHEGEVSAVAFTPDGKYAVSGGEDRTVRLWKIPS